MVNLSRILKSLAVEHSVAVMVSKPDSNFYENESTLSRIH